MIASGSDKNALRNAGDPMCAFTKSAITRKCFLHAFYSRPANSKVAIVRGNLPFGRLA